MVKKGFGFKWRSWVAPKGQPSWLGRGPLVLSGYEVPGLILGSVLKKRKFLMSYGTWFWGIGELSSDFLDSKNGDPRFANFSSLVNENPRGKIFAYRGLKQDNPLSLFLFNLMVDILRRLVSLDIEKYIMEDFVVGNDLVPLSHL